jgi:DNA-binding transcriptional LysR family regulator
MAAHKALAWQRNPFDLNLFPVLDALLDERSVTRAAQRLGRSQPAVSASLRRLRDYLDDPLLVPLGRGQTLSPRARALIEPVREAMQAIHSLLGR